MITAAQARKHLRYDECTGRLWWRIPASGRKMNVPAGGIGSQGYYCLTVLGKSYRAPRLIWLMKTGRWPNPEVDHENTIRSDDRWKNLREATRSQNRANCSTHKNNTSGHKGVSWHKQRNKWYVTIQQNGKPKFIGLYANKSAAALAYRAAAKMRFGEFARA